ncbi:unnamed protein product [Adineta steineri]|uniref:Uncharacterized protein n=1 Tax=Adineta steineri TaxID=433720 RepID=A0A813U9F8_9BILA|nr:unnamed protein product [Adineta steineri]CAF1511961.1 unnamed protein product [Adineta steineri]CAF3924424.1 unnamed protein product [Adineta steineri]CAF4132478.1 unnamed protein product [Adineta steineri]
MARTNSIMSHVDKFLQQKPDHEWLMVPLNCKGGKDQFKNTVIYSTFPANLSRDDFAYYIDMTFGDLSESMKRRLKVLFIPNHEFFKDENIDFDYGTINGKISASLVQVISQKNTSNELEIIVGVISLVRTPEIGWHFNNDYWKSDKDRVRRGLQYIFGNEAQKVISHN